MPTPTKPDKKPLKPGQDPSGKWQAALYHMRKRRKARAGS